MSHVRIRQICLIAHDLDRIQRQLENVFGVEVAHRDPSLSKYGLHNMLLPFGNQLLETVSPKSEEHDTAGGRYLKRRGGDGGYMVIMQVPRQAYGSYQARCESMGVRVIWEPGEGLEDTGGFQLHPKDVPGAIAEIRWNVEEQQSDGAWWPAGPNWQIAKHTEIVDGIVAAEIQTADPNRLAARWGAVLNEPVASDAQGHPILRLDGADIRFVIIRDGRPAGLGGLDIRTTDKQTAVKNAEKAGCLAGDDLVMICGTRLRLV